MKILASGQEAASQFSKLIKRHDRVRIAAAWATRRCPLFPVLSENTAKISDLTIGIHFYQTDPDFIEAFREHPAARFVMNPAGVFHPKVYLFESEGGRWSAIIGSPNLTHGAFTKNDEIAVAIDSSDIGAEDAYRQLDANLIQYRAQGHRMDRDGLERYRQVWRRQQQRLASLRGDYTISEAKTRPRPTKSPLEVPLFVQSWSEYFASIMEGSKGLLEGGLAVLEEARRLFAQHDHFSDMPVDVRKGIAGIMRTEELDWLWFGSMRGAGYFKEAIGLNNSVVSEALDTIPSTGAVTQSDYDRFAATYANAFQDAGVATGTRLLAIKRPDYFVCFDSKNRKALCKTFEIPQDVRLESYWDRIVARITETNWWNDTPPTDPLQRRVWQCRAAFLDVLFYEPGGREDSEV
ncbi:hypothetical protein Pla175_17750 [Pirellulimonas nuda]|uniref:PLD phosphodiesterase domain-containing protein n=1 Tax=Pirellulimonas nuda TaxID=2528009 RepID=A0A518DA90_9BACT|nr:phospholipase D family protein [Pirellulimonas nuda]QDU88399.1 hypothetical protein Pla175_17750 [Pirellulimonas nuda]